MRSIHAIGYDMDYTLVHYNVDAWEGIAYEHIRGRLAAIGFPVQDLSFDPKLVTRGLVIDRELGNVVKANRFGYVKIAMHGGEVLEYREMRTAYARTYVDLGDPRWVFLNTLFSISEACIYSQLVALVDSGAIEGTWKYSDLYSLVRKAVDAAHLEGELKTAIMSDPDRYVELDPGTAAALLDQKMAGKKLMVITNSEWEYTTFMMSYAFDQYLPDEMTWRDLFDVVIVAARKPLFFMEPGPIYEVVTEDGLLRPVVGGIQQGRAYLGGNARLVEQCFDLDGEQILYVGDHIYGDVNVSKQICRWRTALVLRELEEELDAISDHVDHQRQIASRMAKKEQLEHEMSAVRLRLQRIEKQYGEVETADTAELREKLGEYRAKLVTLDQEIAPLVGSDGREFNSRWGFLLRAGNDKSHMTRQIERYADIYTSRVSNLEYYTPFMYFRSPRGSLPHDPGNP